MSSSNEEIILINKELESTRKFLEESKKIIEPMTRYRNAAVSAEKVVQAYIDFSSAKRDKTFKKQIFLNLQEEYEMNVKIISNPSLKPLEKQLIEDEEEDEEWNSESGTNITNTNSHTNTSTTVTPSPAPAPAPGPIRRSPRLQKKKPSPKRFNKTRKL